MNQSLEPQDEASRLNHIAVIPFVFTQISGGHSVEVTPDPIPNSEVKPRFGDGTAGLTRWESSATVGSKCETPLVERPTGSLHILDPREPLAGSRSRACGTRAGVVEHRSNRPLPRAQGDPDASCRQDHSGQYQNRSPELHLAPPPASTRRSSSSSAGRVDT